MRRIAAREAGEGNRRDLGRYAEEYQTFFEDNGEPGAARMPAPPSRLIDLRDRLGPSGALRLMPDPVTRPLTLSVKTPLTFGQTLP